MEHLTDREVEVLRKALRHFVNQPDKGGDYERTVQGREQEIALDLDYRLMKVRRGEVVG